MFGFKFLNPLVFYSASGSVGIQTKRCYSRCKNWKRNFDCF